MILLDTNIFIFGDSILLKEAEEHEVEVINRYLEQKALYG